jgi:hypothetical protein
MLREALLDCAADSLTGALRLTGEPGGAIYFANGAITAIDTPGAPGPEVILLRSGRVGEQSWAAAFAAGAAGGRMGAELHTRGLVGSGELEALLRVVLADGMFVLASGHTEAWEVEQAPTGHLLPLSPAADPGWLLSEAARRMRALQALPTPIEHDRDRLTPVAGLLPPGGTAGAAQDKLLALANGRRTARDMAFVLGRGVFAVTLQLARMHEAGLVMIDSRRPARAGTAGPGADGPAGPGGRPSPGDGACPGGPGGAAGVAGSLPRRRWGASVLPRRGQPASGLQVSGEAAGPQAGKAQGGRPQDGKPPGTHAEKPALLRLLRPGSATGERGAGKDAT